MNYKDMRNEKFGFVYIYDGTKKCWVDGTMLPRLEELSKEYKNSKFFPIDTKKNPEVSGEFLVFVTPVLIIYYDGIEIMKKVRFFSISEIKSEIEKFLEKIL